MARAYRFASRVDANQKEMTKMLRMMGVSVWLTHDTAQPGVDAVIGLETKSGRKVNVLIEIKDGTKPLSQQKLTPKEVDFHRSWKGEIVILNSKEQAFNFVRSIQEMEF